jgi:hypothetical protein
MTLGILAYPKGLTPINIHVSGRTIQKDFEYHLRSPDRQIQ